MTNCCFRSYSHYVQEWATYELDKFSNLTIYVSIPQINHTLVGPLEAKDAEVEEHQVGSQDSYAEGSADSAPAYQPLYYAVSGVNVVGPGTPADPWGLDYGAILEYSDDLKMDIAFRIDGSTVYVSDIPLMQRAVHHHAKSRF